MEEKNDKPREIHADISIEIIPSPEEIKSERERMRRKDFRKKMREVFAWAAVASIPLAVLFCRLEFDVTAYIAAFAFPVAIIWYYCFYE